MEYIVLASESPRRQDFFRMLKLPFTCIPAMIDETPQPGLSPRQISENLALQKVQAVVRKLSACQQPLSEHGGGSRHQPMPKWVFGADTIVVLDGTIYGKPADRDEAKQMLQKLSGQKHEVITAMTLVNTETKKTDCKSVSGEVVFACLSAAEIEWYLDTNEWQGAAGAYQLQGRGGCFIKSINGSPSGIAGLPLHDFYVMLKDNGCPLGS